MGLGDAWVDSLVDGLNEDEAKKQHDLTPSEVALAKVLAAWEEWPGDPGDEEGDASHSLAMITAELDRDGWVLDGKLTEQSKALLDRARKAGVV